MLRRRRSTRRPPPASPADRSRAPRRCNRAGRLPARSSKHLRHRQGRAAIGDAGRVHGFETAPLLRGIAQFVVAIGEFDAAIVELKSLRDFVASSDSASSWRAPLARPGSGKGSPVDRAQVAARHTWRESDSAIRRGCSSESRCWSARLLQLQFVRQPQVHRTLQQCGRTPACCSKRLCIGGSFGGRRPEQRLHHLVDERDPRIHVVARRGTIRRS